MSYWNIFQVQPASEAVPVAKLIPKKLVPKAVPVAKLIPKAMAKKPTAVVQKAILKPAGLAVRLGASLKKRGLGKT